MWLVLAVLVASTGLAGAPPATAQGGPVDQRLAERFAPVLRLQAQEEECDDDGEPYLPVSVDVLLGNPQVLLRQVGLANPVVRQGPTATDLYGLGEGFYLDFPGDALAPGCIYERDERRFNPSGRSTVYARVIEEAGDEGDQLVVQYWFWWYFNDWNNKHEGDWEGIALRFDVPTAAEALQRQPVEVGYAQHSGGERSSWDSDKLERDGDRPVVYPSAGSHASYFTAALHLGRSASEGFGCDDTGGISRDVDPDVVVLPAEVDDPDDPLAWLAFEGRWGERQSGPFNGPTGPARKSNWTDPIGWFDGLRDSSVTVPGGDRAGDTVVTTFCGTVEAGSDLLVALKVSPATTLLALAVVVGAVYFVVHRTDWSPTEPLPIRRRRRFGQILRTSAVVYRRHPFHVAALGLAFVPLMALAVLAVSVVDHLPLLGDLIELAGERSGTAMALIVLLGGGPQLVALLLVNAGIADWLGQLEAGRRLHPLQCGARLLARAGDLLVSLLVASALVLVLFLSVIGIPWAVRELVRYQFLGPVLMLEGRTGRAALARSGQLVRGRWWHTAVAVVLIHGATLAIEVVVGLLVLLLVTELPLWAFAVAQGVLAASLVPFASIALTLLYGDAVAQHDRPEPEDGPEDGAVAVPVLTSPMPDGR